MNTLNGYSKSTLTDKYVLTAAGGHLAVGNAANNIPLNNNTVNTNLNADKLDGYHLQDIINKVGYIQRVTYKNGASGFNQTNPFWIKVATITKWATTNSTRIKFDIEAQGGSDSPLCTSFSIMRSYDSTNTNKYRGIYVTLHVSSVYSTDDGCFNRVIVDSSNNVWLYYGHVWPNQTFNILITARANFSEFTLLSLTEALATITTTAPTPVSSTADFTFDLNYTVFKSLQGSATAYNITAVDGFYKQNSSNDYVLLGAGGHKLITDLIKGGYIGTTQVLPSSKELSLTGIGHIAMSGKINEVFKVIKSLGVALLNIEEVHSSINYSHLYVSSNNESAPNSRPLVLLVGYGNVGIGTASPKSKLSVNAYCSTLPTLGNLGVSGTVEIGSAGSYGTYFWTQGSGKGYILLGRADGTATAYDLILQLLGGKVGIGIESPTQKLHVNGDIFLNNYLYFTDAAAARIKYGTHTATALGSYPLPSLGSNGLGLYVRPGKGTDEGGIIITEDTCMIFNSGDAGWSFQVHNTDLKQKDFSGTEGKGELSRAFGITENTHYAWSRGGFLKNGSSDSYALLGGGGHKAIGNASGNIPLSNSTVNTNLNSDLLDGLHAGTSNGTVAIYTSFPSSTTLINDGFLESDYVDRGHPDELFLKAICKWAINKYSGVDPITNTNAATLIGHIHPNSTGTCIIHLYRNSGKDSTTLLPRYCRGLYQTLGGALFLFGTSDYVWSYWRYAHASEIPNVTNYYWADISILSTSDATKVPTFGGIKTNGNIILGTEGILGFGSSIPSKYLNSAAISPDASAVWLATTGNVTGVAGLEASGIVFDGNTIKMWAPIDSAVQLIDSDDGKVYNFYHSGNLTKVSLLTNDAGYITGSYLPLAGGLMDTSAFISWNDGADGNDVSDWNFTTNGLKIISSARTDTNSPTQYATALHVKGRYGFLLASLGGSSSNTFYIKNVHNTIWNTLIHSNNYTSYTVKKDGTGASGTWAINISGNADTVDNYHASSLVKFYLSPMTSGAPADSAKSWFTDTMPAASGAIIYNVPGSEKTIIAGKSSGAHGHMLQLSYNDTYLRILRYTSGSWKSTDWEKISAGYADSAGTASSAENATNATNATNADTVDGYHATRGNNKPWGTIPAITENGYMDVGKHFEFHFDNTTGSDYSTVLMCTGNYSNIVSLPSASGTLALTSLLSSYLPLSGGWMNWNALICFKGLNESTSVFGKIGYAKTASNLTMHCLSSGGYLADGALYIISNGSTGANDTGGLAIDNEGVTVFGAGDAGSNFTGIFRVLNEDNVADGPQFIVTKASGATVKYNMYAAHFYENSDILLKTNIQEILNSDKMPIIKEFDWKEDNSHSYGLIAQELEEQGYSELVSTKDDGYKTVNYSAALSLIVGKLQVKIKELEKEIENLKNKN